MLRWNMTRAAMTAGCLGLLLFTAHGCASDEGSGTGDSDTVAGVTADASGETPEADSEDTPPVTADIEEDASQDEAETVDTAPPAPSFEWPVGDCADQPAGTGVEVGDTAFDFTMEDQYGQMVSLHDFCDKTILLVGSAFWCPGCIDKAPTLDAIYQAHRDKGLLIITLLTETLDNEPCTAADLKIWADEYGQTFPVLSDVDGYIHTFTPKAGGKLPMEVLLGPGVEILTVIDDVSEQDLIDILP